VPHTPTRRTGRTTAGLIATTLLAAGLMASTASMAAAPGFDAKMSAFATQIKSDPSYKRIPLETTAERQWFYNQSEAVYTKKITKEQFIAEGVKLYPGYEASFAAVADFMSK